MGNKDSRDLRLWGKGAAVGVTSICMFDTDHAM